MIICPKCYSNKTEPIGRGDLEPKPNPKGFGDKIQKFVYHCKSCSNIFQK